MPKINWNDFFKKLGIGLVVSFLAFQAISLLLGNFFPTFKTIANTYPLIWMWLLFAAILILVGRLVLNYQTIDRRNIFFTLLALAILTAIIVYFNLDLGRLFNMSVVKADLSTLASSIMP